MFYKSDLKINLHPRDFGNLQRTFRLSSPICKEIFEQVESIITALHKIQVGEMNDENNSFKVQKLQKVLPTWNCKSRYLCIRSSVPDVPVANDGAK